MEKHNKKNITTWGFIMSVLGAAVGLGGIWGFPTQMNKHHGIFLIPFFIALIICALPILLIEINLGNKYRKNHVDIFTDLAKTGGAFFGFLQTAVVWLLSVFYSVLVAWSLLALIMAFLPGLNQLGFFLNHLIGETNNNPQNFSELGNISIWVLISLFMVWIITGFILLGGVTKGIDIANKIFIPGLFIMITIMMIYVLTLPGAINGIQEMFSFHIKDVLNSEIWTDAFGQAFFMLSTCTGVIIIFSSHAPIGKSNTNKGLIIMIGTVIVALLTTCTVFGAIGAIANNDDHQTINDVFVPGPTLIFQVFPQVFAIITQQTNMPLLSHLLAIFFFLSVFFAGISSLIAMTETVVNPLISSYNVKRYQALLITIISSFGFGLIFCFNNSSALINGLAVWVAGIWQMIIGIFELIGVIIFWKCYDELQTFNNQNSAIKWNKGFKYLCLIIIPIIIAINLAFAIFQIITNIMINPFVYLTIGMTMGAISVLIFTIIFTYWNNIKCFFIKSKKIIIK